MAYKSLRDFIDQLEADGELVRVSEPVSTVLEMTEIQTRLLRNGGPAVLLESDPHDDAVGGPDHPRLTIQRAVVPPVNQRLHRASLGCLIACHRSTCARAEGRLSGEGGPVEREVSGEGGQWKGR